MKHPARPPFLPASLFLSLLSLPPAIPLHTWSLILPIASPCHDPQPYHHQVITIILRVLAQTHFSSYSSYVLFYTALPAPSYFIPLFPYLAPFCSLLLYFILLFSLPWVTEDKCFLLFFFIPALPALSLFHLLYPSSHCSFLPCPALSSFFLLYQHPICFYQSVLSCSILF